MRIQDQAISNALHRIGQAQQLAGKVQKNLKLEKALQKLESDLDAALSDGELSFEEAEALLSQAKQLPGMESVVKMLEDFLQNDEDGIMTSREAESLMQEIGRTSFLDQDLIEQQQLLELENLIRRDIQIAAAANQKEHETAMNIIRNIGSA